MTETRKEFLAGFIFLASGFAVLCLIWLLWGARRPEVLFCLSEFLGIFGAGKIGKSVAHGIIKKEKRKLIEKRFPWTLN